ncbi:hypothetical protein DM806_21595 [Sphingobium lactosutens]|nr:hypothetical protein [Sphingobium lactosutens]
MKGQIAWREAGRLLRAGRNNFILPKMMAFMMALWREFQNYSMNISALLDIVRSRRGHQKINDLGRIDER